MLGFVRSLCELQLVASLVENGIRPHPHFELRYRHGDLCSTSPLFSKGRIKASRGENHSKSGYGESFSYADGEIVVLVHASRRERDVTYETCSLSHCVFSTVFN